MCHRFSATVDDTKMCEKCRENVPPPLTFAREKRSIVPLKRHGIILTPGEWFDIKRHVDRFYQEVLAEDIDRRNEKTRASRIFDTHESAPLVPPPTRRVDRPGYVYILKSNNGYHKIGRTKNIDKRLVGIARDYPVHITALHYFPCRDCVGAELRLHRRFADCRLQGEWFDLSDEQVAWLVTITEKDTEDDD